MGGARGRAYAIDGEIWHSVDGAAVVRMCGMVHGGDEEDGDGVRGSRVVMMMYAWWLRFYIIKDKVENGVVDLDFVNTEYQLADIFTKALSRERIDFLINKLGMQSFMPETLKPLADEAEE
uniref:Retrovirus-related Pol polyprotein from transposon TNT 1-94 n=1 Tax=Tanacetum cinerariifolium TaxID=118510 RepID=A0A6L2MDY3_TANCI|nr:retrovirus-related Pol polyprotein from transposon TNT 1-94 [Tanacetum cinerariifolium]